MLSRKYNRKVEVYNTVPVADGFGGNISTDNSLGMFWAEVKMLSSFKDHAVGVSDIKKTYSFKLRATNEITPLANDLSIIYKSQKYVVNDITYDDENFRFVNIIANG